MVTPPDSDKKVLIQTPSMEDLRREEKRSQDS